MSTFEGKVVMVTGASGALGSVVCQKFYEAGATLVLSDRSEEHIDALLTQLGDQHTKIIADLGDPEAVAKAIEQIEAQGYQIDVLVHTVGGYAGGNPVHEDSVTTLQKQLYINTQALFVTCGAVAAHMLRHAKGGKIIMTLSGLAEKGPKNNGATAASKAAARSIMQSMAAELQEHHINVNGVSPSTMDTEANRKAMPKADFSKWVKPEAVADAMLFLASSQADHIRGMNLGVYG